MWVVLIMAIGAPRRPCYSGNEYADVNGNRSYLWVVFASGLLYTVRVISNDNRLEVRILIGMGLVYGTDAS